MFLSTLKRPRKIIWIPIAVILIVVVAIYFYLDVWATKYVNRVLGEIKGYQGSVENVSIHVYRGAYELHGLKINKVSGNIPAPFVDIALVDFSIEWQALMQGRIVSEIALEKPILNFAVSKSGAKQTGKEGNWQDTIAKLMPIDINTITMHRGEVHYRDFSAQPKVDLFITNLNGEIKNLRSVVDKNDPLPASIDISGDSIGQGKASLKGKLNILSEPVDLDIDGKLEHANLTYINDYTRDLAAIDFESGKLSVYSKIMTKKGKIQGYIKPIATDVHVISLKNTNPVKLLWETAAGFVIEIFTNQRKDQFATQINLEGDLNHPKTDTWSIIYGVFHNAFVKAYSNKITNE